MADWISGTLAVLGTLMVLAGAALIVLRTIGRVGAVGGAPAAGADESAVDEPTRAGRRFMLRRLTPATQLIAWGGVLLVFSALTVGLISFGFSLEVGTP